MGNEPMLSAQNSTHKLEFRGKLLMTIVVFIGFVIMCLSIYEPYYTYQSYEPPKLNYRLTDYATENNLIELKAHNITSITFKNSNLAPKLIYETSNSSESYQLRWKDSSINNFYGYVSQNEVAIVTKPNIDMSIDSVAEKIGTALDAVISDIKYRQRQEQKKREWELSERVEAN
tara:strand:+ start:22491 stop:23012 length:522 start_codon:yes stop_codon:yes gene_type:complete